MSSTEPTDSRLIRNTPRIYVACLAAYNAGSLHGTWVDADQCVDDIEVAIQYMLATSPVTDAEEWAIHDYEGFGSLRLGEWEPIHRVASIAAGIAAYGVAYAEWLAYDSSQDPADTESFSDSYLGEWDSLLAYADELADSMGLYEMAQQSGSPYVIVDIDMLSRDLEIELYTAKSEHGVYIFDPNA